MRTRTIRCAGGTAALMLASAAMGQTSGLAAAQTPPSAPGVSVGGGGSALPSAPTCVALSGQPRAPSSDILSVEAGATYTDNILLSASDPRSQTLAEAALRYETTENRPRLCSDISADLHFFDYLHSTFPNQVVGGASGVVNFAIVPKRFIWLLQDNFGQIAQNPQEVSTPLNRQNVNFLTTGPRLTLPLNSSTMLSVRAFYEQAYYQHTDTNTRGTNESLSLAQEISNRDTVSLETSASHVTYTDLPVGLAYDVYEAYARFLVHPLPVGQTQAQGRGGIAITADVGESALHFAGASEHGLIARLAISGPVGAFSNVALNAGTQFSDSAGVFVLDQTSGGIVVGNDTAAASNSPFRLDYGYLTWQTSRERTSLSISANWTQESYQSGAAMDLRQLGGSAGLSRRITARVAADVGAAWSRQQYAGTGAAELQQRTFGAGITWKFARRWAFAAHAYHVTGGAPVGVTSGGLTGGDYRANSVYASIRYSLVGR